MQSFPVHQEHFTEIRDRLSKLFHISTHLDFPFTLEEVATYFLPKANLTPTQLRSLLSSEELTDLGFVLKDGYLLAGNEQTIASRGERERISAAKLASAASFANLLAKLVPFIRTVAVTGSVAYGSADKWDDIDLFVVTDRNRLWVSALLMLIQVRLYKLFALRAPHLLPFCLSYVHDAEGFSRESGRNRANSLFARELLKAEPVAGFKEYRRILQENSWVSQYYPVPYSEKLEMLGETFDGSSRPNKSSGLRGFFLDWAEGIAYELLSRYLRLRAYIANLKFESEGRNLRTFDPIISAASCVYTSNFYRWLSALWAE
jgi:hypothetical protein